LDHWPQRRILLPRSCAGFVPWNEVCRNDVCLVFTDANGNNPLIDGTTTFAACSGINWRMLFVCETYRGATLAERHTCGCSSSSGDGRFLALRCVWTHRNRCNSCLGVSCPVHCTYNRQLGMELGTGDSRRTCSASLNLQSSVRCRQGKELPQSTIENRAEGAQEIEG